VRSIQATRCAEVLVELYELRLELERHALHAALDRQASVQRALANLRGVATTDRLLEQVPRELCRCGFGRAWVARLDESHWQLVAFHDETPLRKSPLTSGGVAERQGLLGQLSHEVDMIRRRRAVLVVDAAGDPLVNPLIAETFAPDSYVAAPLLVGTRVVGFVHADHDGVRRASEEDRLIAALFAEAVGQVLQRVVLAERLDGLRHEMRCLTGSIVDRIDEQCWTPVNLGSLQATEGEQPAANLSSHGATAPPRDGSRLESLLTARELEVLRLLATGETNTSIAVQLVISPGTVKCHVKSILRKLRAANRTEAVSRYLRMMGTGNRAC
jgi:DNA-binding CsgD family transcriptional regulator